MSILKEKFSPAAPYAMVPVRLVLFAVFFYHGTQNLFGWFGGLGLRENAGFLASHGVPLSLAAAFVLALAQILSALSFLLGAGVRLFALVISGLVLGAMTFDTLGAALNIANHGTEYHVATIGMCMALLLGGPGWASIEWADEEGAAPKAIT